MQHDDVVYLRRRHPAWRLLAADERGWLRRYYPPQNDEPHYDLMPATEQAIGCWSPCSGA